MKKKTRATSHSAKKIKYNEASKKSSIDDILDNNIKCYRKEDFKSKCDDVFFDKKENLSVREVTDNKFGRFNSYLNIFNNFLNDSK